MKHLHICAHCYKVVDLKDIANHLLVEHNCYRPDNIRSWQNVQAGVFWGISKERWDMIEKWPKDKRTVAVMFSYPEEG